jgi:hypothetical protein
MGKLSEATIRSLQAQAEFLELARNRHLAWAEDTVYVEIARAHIEIANSLAETISQYQRLLDKYRHRTAW